MTILDRFFEEENKHYGGKSHYYNKEEKLGSKVRAFYVRPFNPEYMTVFTTTWVLDTFFPERKLKDPKSCVRTEFHENVHKWDAKEKGAWFGIGYAFPQIIAPLFILAGIAVGGPWSWLAGGLFMLLLHVGLGVLEISSRVQENRIPSKGAMVGFWICAGLGLVGSIVTSAVFGGWWAFLWFGAVVFFLPWLFRAWWRTKAELRGYTASFYRAYLEYGHIDPKWVENRVKTFTGPNYGFMEPNGSKVRDEFQFQVARMMNDEDAFLAGWLWCKDAPSPSKADAKAAEPFRMIKEFMTKEGMVRG